jgi:pyruvate,water dikinase
VHIRDLERIEPHETAIFGGKACGLARLIAAGARVPPGFAVAATPLPPAAWDAATRDDFCRRVTALLQQGPVAVRSSAVGEDAAEQSFAGLFETVLGVTDVEQALGAAARCVASAHAERVRAYAATPARASTSSARAGEPRNARGESAHPEPFDFARGRPVEGWSAVPVGVIVQRQVDARAAGVCFTIDPTGRDRALVLEAVPGTGDPLVSGHATPERYRVYRSGFGTWEIAPDGVPAPAPALSAADVEHLAAGALAHAAALQQPLDLEWAIDRAGALWWLQARPITAAATAPAYHIDRAVNGVDDGPVSVWFNWNVRETMPDPLMPLTWSLWRDVIVPNLVSEVFGTPATSPMLPHLLALDLVHGRIYFNMNGIIAWPLVGRLMTSRLMHLVDAEGAELCEQLIASGVLRPRRIPGSRARMLVDAVRANLKNGRRFAAAMQPRRALADLRGAEHLAAERERTRPLAALSDADLLEDMQWFAAAELAPLRNGIHYETVAMLVYHLAQRAFAPYPDAAARLAVGLPDNPTTEISLGIDELVAAAGPLAAQFTAPRPVGALLATLEASPEGRRWRARLDDFLARCGQRGPKEFDLGTPRWSEAPDMIVELVRAGLRSPGEAVGARLARLAAERRAAVAAAVAAAPRWRRPVLRGLARLVELYMPLREAPKHYAMFVFQRMRRAALELGARLVRRGVLAAPADVFLVELAELRVLAAGGTVEALPERLAQRRAWFERFQRERAPDYLRSDGVPIVARPADRHAEADGALRGAGVSAGSASGPVRILAEPDPNAMADGDVIVVEFADPGWTPLFPRAAALVMEVGGVMCHAAVVARELGIPAVFGVSGATHRLRDGQRVTVDGSQGTVTVDSETEGRLVPR